jgi:hypothetical protein
MTSQIGRIEVVKIENKGKGEPGPVRAGHEPGVGASRNSRTGAASAGEAKMS